MKYISKINQILLNPFYLYALFFITATLLYPLNWVEYPPLSPGIIGIIFSTVLIAILIGSRLKTSFTIEKYIHLPALNVLLISLLVIASLGFLITFINAGVIPLFQILFQTSTFDYRHGFDKILYVTAGSISLNGAILILSIYLYFQTQKSLYILLFAISFFWLVLYGNRAYAITVLLPGIFIALSKIQLSWKKLVFVTGLFTVGVYVFGLYGDKREEAKGNFDTSLYDEMHAEHYPKWLPEEFIWGYLYFTSPLAKLEYITRDPKYSGQTKDYKQLIIGETIPRSLSKRLLPNPDPEYLLSDYGFPSYFVGTAFSKPFMWARWWGMLIYACFLFVVLWSFPVLTKWYLPIFYLPVVSVVTSMAAISIFDNMLSYSLINFVLYWIVLIGLLYKLSLSFNFNLKNEA